MRAARPRSGYPLPCSGGPSRVTTGRDRDARFRGIPPLEGCLEWSKVFITPAVSEKPPRIARPESGVFTSGPSSRNPHRDGEVSPCRAQDAVNAPGRLNGPPGPAASLLRRIRRPYAGFRDAKWAFCPPPDQPRRRFRAPGMVQPGTRSVSCAIAVGERPPYEPVMGLP